MPRSKQKGKSKRAKGMQKPVMTRAAAPVVINQAEGYGVRIAPAEGTGNASYWKVISVRHLTPEENKGRHNLFVDALDEAGQRCRDQALRIGWTWEGRRPEEEAPPKPLDKPEYEPAGNVDIYPGQHVEVWLEGDGLPSDHVLNMHVEHPDELGPNGELWNSIGHHSFHVIFQRSTKQNDDGEEEDGEIEPPPSTFRFQVWPTEYRTVTQWFGANSEKYAEYNLPGHEGIDIKAPAGSKIFCVAAGRIKRVHLNPDKAVDNYGIHVRVEHANGYETIYAHLQSVAVNEGQTVQAGDLLGLADATGNSDGSHLHLTLKHLGESQGSYPRNIIDPTPFLAPLLATITAAGVETIQVRVADKLGLNCNAPITPQGSISERVANPALIAETCAGWVRLNFIVRPYNAPSDPVWIDTYRRIIQGLRSRGLKIYGLIGAEAVATDPENQFRELPGAGIANHEWIQHYTQNFRQIVQLFGDDVTCFESFNEPNDWHRRSGETWSQAWIHPAWFAIMLQRVYEAVRDLNVTLVSGPLLSTQDGNDAADYLPRVYRAGKERFGWGQPGAPVPFDGVGYHPYLLGDSWQPQAEIPPRYQQYMDDVRQVILAEEGALKPIFLSEMGWQNPEDRQPNCLEVGLRQALDDPTVALCCWYGMQDDEELYGLYRKYGLSPTDRKPAYHRFCTLASEERLVPVARVRAAAERNDGRYGGEFDTVPDGTVLQPAQSFSKIWRMVNTGKTTWAAGYQLVWVEGQSLGAPASVPVPYCPPGQAVDISVRFTTPNEPGEYLSCWRLVDPQGHQFGDTVWTKIQVAVVPAGAPSRAAMPELPPLSALAMAAPLTASQLAKAAALGIIYNSYWLRVLAAANESNPQQAIQSAADDALERIQALMAGG